MTRLLKMNRAIALSLAFIMAVYAIAPMGVAARAAQQTDPNALQVTGTLVNGTFAGVFDITRFAVKNGGVVAIGQLVGTITQTIGGLTTTIPVNQLVTLPVTPGAASCEILNLQIGAISLDLLGLVVNLAPIDLVITAEPGPGNLLGNLLCAVAGLLDGNGNGFGRLAGLLNRILRILG